jgi:uncharacterized protein (UPF0261 family)
MSRIHVVGTADTKGAELAYLANEIRRRGSTPVTVDVGTRAPTIATDVSAREVASFGDSSVLTIDDRGTAVAGMAKAFASYIEEQPVEAIVGIGGGGGTSIVTAGMRRLPIGIPKLMVSTLASGDTAPYVGISDIVMMPAIADLAGLNRISRMVLAQAAAAITGMASTGTSFDTGKAAIGMTMFGVTTKAVTQMIELLGDSVDTIPFHATGTGGKTMEALADSGLLGGVMDITTTEIADLLFGGVLPAGPERLDCIARTRIPYVGSLGACDMINFWAPETMPDKYKGRHIYRHNANVTLMRTTPEENRAIGEWIGNKLNACDGPVRFLIPERGVSALDIEGGDFWDPAADAALFSALIDTVHLTDTRKLIRVPAHINDHAFAQAAVDAFNEIKA